MLRQSAARRPGTSLMEVLIACGIFGIAAASVMAFFPFSALMMRQALQDDRTVTCALMADGLLRDIHKRNVVEPGQQGTTILEEYHGLMDNPGSGLPALSPTDPGPSYPVFLDPMGRAAGAGPVGDFGITRIPRANLSLIANSPNPQQLAQRYTSLMDSLSFNEDGVVTGGFDMRSMIYNFSWMLQRPSNRDRYTVRMQVVVFNGRKHLYRPPGSELVLPATFTPGDTVITGVPNSPDLPKLKGAWVMDGTIGNDPAGRPLRHAEFYRVLSVTETTGNTLALEVHKSIVRADGLVYPPDTSVYRYGGQLVIMAGVAEVFDRPPLTPAVGP